jgi:hypothetical protein
MNTEQLPSAWSATPQELGVRSIALPSDGGIKNSARQFGPDFWRKAPNVAETFERERQRMREAS